MSGPLLVVDAIVLREGALQSVYNRNGFGIGPYRGWPLSMLCQQMMGVLVRCADGNLGSEVDRPAQAIEVPQISLVAGRGVPETDVASFPAGPSIGGRGGRGV